MSSRIDPLGPEEVDDEATSALLREAAATYGDTAYYGALAYRPVLLERLVRLFEPFPDSDSLDGELLELARLAVAKANGCAYCATVRNRDVEDAIADRERAVFEEDHRDLLAREERLTVELAERLSTEPHRITDAFVSELRETFGEEGFVELLLFISLEVGLDRFTIALELTPDEASPYPTDLQYPFDSGEQ